MILFLVDISSSKKHIVSGRYSFCQQGIRVFGTVVLRNLFNPPKDSETHISSYPTDRFSGYFNLQKFSNSECF